MPGHLWRCHRSFTEPLTRTALRPQACGVLRRRRASWAKKVTAQDLLLDRLLGEATVPVTLGLGPERVVEEDKPVVAPPMLLQVSCHRQDPALAGERTCQSMVNGPPMVFYRFKLYPFVKIRETKVLNLWMLQDMGRCQYQAVGHIS